MHVCVFKGVIVMMTNCFCSMADRQKTFSLISSWDHCQGSSPLWISDMPQAGFELVQNLSSSFVEWSCAVVITTTPPCQNIKLLELCNSSVEIEVLSLSRTLKFQKIFAKLKFSQSCLKKYHYLFVWCLKLKINEF